MQITIDNLVYQKIMYWVRKASPQEVSGLGKVVIIEDGFRVINAMLLPQENSSGATDIDGEDLSKAMFELKDDPGHLNFWWHSHGQGTVFWSATDKETVKDLGSNGWFIASVFNTKAEIKSCYYQGKVTGLPAIFVDEIPTRPVFYYDSELEKQWNKEYDDNVKTKTWAGYSGGSWRAPINDEIKTQADLKGGYYAIGDSVQYVSPGEIKENKIRISFDGVAVVYTRKQFFNALKKQKKAAKKDYKWENLNRNNTQRTKHRTLDPCDLDILYALSFTNADINGMDDREIDEWLEYYYDYKEWHGDARKID